VLSVVVVSVGRIGSMQLEQDKSRVNYQ